MGIVNSLENLEMGFQTQRQDGCQPAMHLCQCSQHFSEHPLLSVERGGVPVAAAAAGKPTLPLWQPQAAGEKPSATTCPYMKHRKLLAARSSVCPSQSPLWHL